MNRAILIGHLCKDIELRYTSTNKPVAQFTIAVNKKYKETERTDYINCTTWDNLAVNLSKYCGKGSLIGIEGEIRNDSYTDQNGNKKYHTYVLANKITFLNTKKKDTQEQPKQADNYPFQDFSNDLELSDEDYPF